MCSRNLLVFFLKRRLYLKIAKRLMRAVSNPKTKRLTR